MSNSSRPRTVLSRCGWLVAATLLLTLTGCPQGPDGQTQPKDPDADIRAARAALSEEDRALVEAQEYCAVHSDNRLGSMDTPVKVMLNGKPVFLCCGGCEKAAKADPDKTLAKVEELKAKVKESKKTAP
jgi:hypothetical protein